MPGSEYYDEDKRNMGIDEDGVKPQIAFNTAEDFGFSTTDIDGIARKPEIKNQIDVSKKQKNQAEDRVEEMYNAILPLINNLLKDAEKNPYIHWPNRTERLVAFRKTLDDIKNR